MLEIFAGNHIVESSSFWLEGDLSLPLLSIRFTSLENGPSVFLPLPSLLPTYYSPYIYEEKKE